MKKKQELKIIIPEFITHVPLTKVKSFKLNSQALYSGNLHYRQRDKVVHFLHEYLMSYMPNNVKITKFPIQIALNFYVPKNYGTLRRIKNRKTGEHYISWHIPKEDYKINWDIGNYGYLWLKTFLDALQIKGIIPDDNAEYVKTEGPSTFIEVNDIKERKLEFIIKEI